MSQGHKEFLSGLFAVVLIAVMGAFGIMRTIEHSDQCWVDRGYVWIADVPGHWTKK